MLNDTIMCLECGKQVRVIHALHLRSPLCTGLTKSQYVQKHPNTPLTSDAAWKAKSKASRQLMDSGYRDVLVKRVTEMNGSPERRAGISRETKARWDSGTQREDIALWHRENKELSHRLAANARTHLDLKGNMLRARQVHVKTSKLHLGFKGRMVSAGLTDFVTEGQVGPFQVDEANYAMKVAVEIDGCWWHGCSTCGYAGIKSTLNNDKSKNAYLATMGWVILRIPGHEVKTNPDAGIARIRSLINSASQEVTS